MANPNSFITIDSVKARALAEGLLDRIRKARNAAVREHVLQRQKELNNSWWRRLLRRKPLTYEEVLVIEDQVEPTWNNKLARIEFWWSEDINVAHDILGACDEAANINVTSEALNTLKGMRWVKG